MNLLVKQTLPDYLGFAKPRLRLAVEHLGLAFFCLRFCFSLCFSLHRKSGNFQNGHTLGTLLVASL